LSGEQRRPFRVACFAERHRQAELGRDRQRLQPRLDELVDQAVPDIAGRTPADHIGDDRAGFGGAGEGGPMRVAHGRLVAAQESGAQLHRAGAEHARRRRGAPIGHPAGGNHRDAHRIDNLRQERKKTGVLPHRDAGKGRPVAAGLGALRDHGIHPPRFEQACLGHRGGAREDEYASRFDGLYDLRFRQAEMKADHLWFRFQKHREMFGADVADRSSRFRHGAKAPGIVTRLQELPHRLDDLGGCRGFWPHRIIDVEAAAALLPKPGDSAPGVLRGEAHMPSPPSPPALLTAAASAGVLISPIGACMIGHSRCSRSVSALDDHMNPSRWS